MYLFLPVFNKGLDNINQSQLKIMIITLIAVFIVLKDYMNPKFDLFRMNEGYSVVWFLIFYSTGAYFGKFKEVRSLSKRIMWNLIYILIFCNSSYLCFALSEYPINKINPNFKDKYINFFKSLFITRISAMPMILQSITLILFVTNINYNKYIAKIITFIGPLTFGVFLIHDNCIIRNVYIKNIFNNYSKDEPYTSIIKIILFKSLKIFVLCATIDYLRNILFSIFQIRRFCIFLEKFICLILG